MNILAFDTSTSYESIALSHNGQIIADVTLNAQRTHSERLLPTVENLLSQTELKLEELSGIAVSIGPGSFTGLRIGLSTAKGLCFGLKLPLYVVSTLKSLANNVYLALTNICTLMDAGRDELYYAVYSPDLTEIQKPAIAKIEKILSVVDKDTILVGPISSKMKEAFLDANDTTSFARTINCYPKASSLIDIIENKKGFEVYKADDISKVEPLYIRRSAAEENFKPKQKNNRIQ